MTMTIGYGVCSFRATTPKTTTKSSSRRKISSAVPRSLIEGSIRLKIRALLYYETAAVFPLYKKAEIPSQKWLNKDLALNQQLRAEFRAELVLVLVGYWCGLQV